MWTRRLTRLNTFLQGLLKSPSAVLEAIVREKRYPLLMREAALRCLVWRAPLAVTKGAPFPARRRHVRQHHGV